MTQADTIRAEDLEHLHRMVDHLTADEVQRAMDLLEDIFYCRPKVRARIEDAAHGPTVPMDQVLAEYGLSEQDLHADFAANEHSERAA